MKYSYTWLRELSGTQKSIEDLVEFLTMRAFEVDAVEKVGFDTEGVIIGEVTELVKHPNADRLFVAQVGMGSSVLQIVCGAPNISVGQKVPVAMVGTKLAGNFEIRKSVIRDVDSCGMICSQRELGLDEDHDGIMVLSENAPVGMELRDFLKDEDFLLDIKVLPDRAHDALSHVGMAREIAALELGELDYDYESLAMKTKPVKEFHVTIKDTVKCSRYMGALLPSIKIKSSPTWLCNRLKKLGIRSVNNVVDVTNFVMQELGQPLHAFDWDALATKDTGVKDIVVRGAKEGEKIRLLDNEEYTLTPEDIVIADSEKSLALAGIMGGMMSSITQKTERVFLESACFDAVSIRKTRTRLGIRTDASDRFEKALDAHIAEKALVRALELLAHIAEGETVLTTDVYPSPDEPQVISLKLTAAEKLLGILVDETVLTEQLPRFGFVVSPAKKRGVWDIVVPTFRLDITTPEDVIEEIGKMIGYDAIPATAPKLALSGVTKITTRAIATQLLSNAVANGFTESLNYAFYSKKDNEAIGMTENASLALSNPMNPDQALMRSSLLPHLLRNVRENLKHQKSVHLCELGRVYYTSEFQPAHETTLFAGIMVLEKSSSEVFFVLKELLERVLRESAVTPLYNTADCAGQYWHPTRTADVFGEVGKDALHIGRIGEVHPFVLEYFQLKKRVAYFELDIASVVKAHLSKKTFTLLHKYPESVRDISLLVPNEVRVKDITEAILRAGEGIVRKGELFDQYINEKQTKSLAFHLHFGHPDRTLEGTEVDKLMEKILKSLEKNLKVTLRG
jgi:phenylalanyl-tRNA synthetase beta chain